MNNSLLRKINSKKYNVFFTELVKELGNKKVLIFGAGLAFEELEKRFNLTKLNVVGISDIKFVENGQYLGLKSIPPSAINDFDTDVILITEVDSNKAIEYWQENSKINKKVEIINLWQELIPGETEFLEYLEKINLEKHLKNISKKLKNKKIVIYGAGVFFQTIQEYYDLSKLNIIAISDRKFEDHAAGESFLGYSVCAPNEISGLQPDYVLVAMLWFIDIVDYLYCELLAGTKIKIKPLIKKTVRELLKEIWGK